MDDGRVSFRAKAPFLVRTNVGAKSSDPQKSIYVAALSYAEN